jgi:hypothetical protein
MKFIKYLLSLLLDTPKGTRLEEYIIWKNPQNNADLDAIVREYNELRYW